MKSWSSRVEALRGYLREHETKVRFVLAGGLNTAFGLAAYPALFYMLAPFKLHYLSVLVVSQVICITFSFFTNKHLVFRTRGSYLKEYGKFATFHLSYLLVNLAALPALVKSNATMPKITGNDNENSKQSLSPIGMYYPH